MRIHSEVYELLANLNFEKELGAFGFNKPQLKTVLQNNQILPPSAVISNKSPSPAKQNSLAP
jgi:hypothetical protein